MARPKRNPTERFLEKVEKVPGGCWEWRGGRGKHGYGGFWLDGVMCSAHRASYELHIGPIPLGMHVCHRCDHRSCVNPQHLFLGTNADNVRDRVVKGRTPSGPAHYKTKFTHTDIDAIRSDGRPHLAIAQHYGVAHGTIGAIKRGENWKYGAVVD